VGKLVSAEELEKVPSKELERLLKQRFLPENVVLQSVAAPD
jgi:hypothetical protein